MPEEEPRVRYEPTIEDHLEAQKRMTPEQKEMSATREIFVQNEPQLLNLPENLQYDLTPGFSVTGWRRHFISGKRGDETFYIGRRIYDIEGGAPEFSGKVNGQVIEDSEAQRLWDEICPVVETYDKYENEVFNSAKRIEKEEEANKSQAEAGMEAKYQQKLDALAETRKEEVRKLLDERSQTMELDDGERQYLQELISGIASLSITEYENMDKFIENYAKKKPESIYNVLRYWEFKQDGSGQRNDQGVRDGYDRRKSLVFSLLGADAEKRQVWQGGFGAAIYVDSVVYTTVLPDIIIRQEAHDPQSSGAGTSLHIERNSRFKQL